MQPYATLLLLPLAAATAAALCGDPECGLACAPDQECRPTGTSCILAPCCEAWQCSSPRYPSNPEGCPGGWPDPSEPCEQGLECRYDWETCCGEEVPGMLFSCEGSGWSMIAIDSLCDIYGPDAPCGTTTAPPTTTPPEEQVAGACPEEQPDVSEPCEPGTSCPYGMEECCGDMLPDTVFECDGSGHWQQMIIDSLCDFGLPCPDTTAA